jgi:hypothetical protein
MVVDDVLLGFEKTKGDQYKIHIPLYDGPFNLLNI